jgi:glycosyltransferase involved in cell wall biosynthesis
LVFCGRSRLRLIVLPATTSIERDLVSVLVAAYNPRYLRAALDSVTQQTWRSIEIVLCDDCPSDAVKRVVDEFVAQSIAEVRYFKNSEHFGVRRTYERCFELARGEFCKFLNDDDLLDPTCVERMVAALRRFPSAHLATSHRRRVDERGFPLSDQPATTPITRDDRYIDGLSLVNALLMLGLNFVGEPSTALFRTSVARVGDENLLHFLDSFGRGVADLVLWTKLAMRGDCVFIADRLSSFRIHAEQQTQASDVSKRALTAIPELRERWQSTKLHERYPPNVLRTWPYASNALDHAATYWQPLMLSLFTKPSETADQMIDDWLARRHPFFAAKNI